VPVTSPVVGIPPRAQVSAPNLDIVDTCGGEGARTWGTESRHNRESTSGLCWGKGCPSQLVPQVRAPSYNVRGFHFSGFWGANLGGKVPQTIRQS